MTADKTNATAVSQRVNKNSNFQNKKQSAPGTKENRLDYLTKLSRGEISADLSSTATSESDSEMSEELSGNMSDSDSSSSEEDAEIYDGQNPLQIPDVSSIGEIDFATKRLAIQNCEWNNVRAQDLL